MAEQTAREALAEHLYFAQVAPKSIEALLDRYRAEALRSAAERLEHDEDYRLAAAELRYWAAALDAGLKVGTTPGMVLHPDGTAFTASSVDGEVR